MIKMKLGTQIRQLNGVLLDVEAGVIMHARTNFTL
jgi:hypothetical protein